MDKKSTHQFNLVDSSAGFTLVEIMVVMALIALIFTVGGNAVSRVTYQRVRSTTRQFVGTIRRIRNDAILLNDIKRLVIDIDNSKWWVETQKKFELLEDNKEESNKIKKSNDPPPSNFALESSYSKKPVELPKGVVFSGVLSEKDGLISKGIAYIHFFPNGFNDQAILFINKEGLKPENSYSVWIKPTAGKIEIHDTYITNFDEKE